MQKWLSTLAMLILPFSSAADEKDSGLAIEDSRQLLVVTTTNWNSLSGNLRLFEGTGADWKQINSWPVVIGRNGLAWGTGLHPLEKSHPQKREGDGKAPAGIFQLSSAFGSAPIEMMASVKLPYLPLDAMIECVDDVKSSHYNSIVNRGEVHKPDWNSSEKMLAIGEQYRLGIVVEHNINPRKQGGGSCIFLHIWENDQTGTAGCTAMEGKQMEKLLQWIDPAKKPLLVQLPEAEYKKLQTVWKLPTLSTGEK